MPLTQLCKIKDRLNITDSTQDTMLTDMLEAVSTAIENYCDRTFTIADHIEQRDGLNGSLLLKNKPINKIYIALSGSYNIIKLEYTGSSVCGVEVDTDKVTVFDNLSGTEYAYSTYTTLTDLVSAINGHTNITATLENSDYGSWSPKMLWVGNNNFDVDGNLIYLDCAYNPITLTRVSDGYYLKDGNDAVKIVYSGGWSVIPADIQEIACKGVVTLYNNRNTTGVTDEETIGDYQYRSSTTVSEASQIIDAYSDALDYYRNEVL